MAWVRLDQLRRQPENVVEGRMRAKALQFVRHTAQRLILGVNPLSGPSR